MQRVADLLVDKGLAEYRPNPAHARAKLLAVTGAGRAALTRIDPGHQKFASRLAEQLGEDGFRDVLDALRRLSGALDAIEGPISTK